MTQRDSQIFTEVLWYLLVDRMNNNIQGLAAFSDDELFNEMSHGFKTLQVTQEEFNELLLPVIRRAIDTHNRNVDTRPVGSIKKSLLFFKDEVSGEPWSQEIVETEGDIPPDMDFGDSHPDDDEDPPPPEL
jgi:hypothetical protein